MLRELRLFLKPIHSEFAIKNYPQLKKLQIPILIRPNTKSIAYARYGIPLDNLRPRPRKVD